MSESAPKAADERVKTVSGSPLHIDFAKAGTVPPVYLVGTFTDWKPEELQPLSEKPDEIHFVHDFADVRDGEHQYKFRLGPGDWWTTDDRVKTVTDEHGNKNNVLIVQNDSPASAKTEITKQTAEKIELMKQTNISNIATPTSNDALPKTATPPKQAASVAAEVADTAAKIDQSSPAKSSDTSAPAHSSEQTGPAPSPSQLEQALAKQSIEPPSTPAASRKLETRKSEETLNSPVAVPPAPSATPVVAPVRPQTPTTPLKSLDSVSPPADVKVSTQQPEITATLPAVSTPPQPALSPALKEIEQKTPSIAAQVALPPSPTPDTQAPEPSQAGEFPKEDDFKLVKRNTTFRERTASILDTIMAVPSAMVTLIASVLQAFMDWLDKTFGSRGGGKDEIEKKSN